MLLDESTLLEIILFILGGAAAIVASAFGIWFRLHAKQEQRIETLQATNGKEHSDLHKKIEHLDEKSEERHRLVRRAVDKILHHLIEKRPGD